MAGKTKNTGGKSFIEIMNGCLFLQTKTEGHAAEIIRNSRGLTSRKSRSQTFGKSFQNSPKKSKIHHFPSPQNQSHMLQIQCKYLKICLRFVSMSVSLSVPVHSSNSVSSVQVSVAQQ